MKTILPAVICAQLATLALTFPSLRGVEGADPFDPDKLAARWTSDGDVEETAEVFARAHAIAFLLGPALNSAVGRHPELDCPKASKALVAVAKEWDLELAFSHWDRAHRDAFHAWLEAIPFDSDETQ